MAMAITAPHYTVGDLAGFPDDGNRYELLDGALLVTPAPSTAHQVIANRIQTRLSVALAWTGLAHVVGPGVVVRLPRTQLQPDVLVFAARFRPDTDWRGIDEHWLAVEVLSRSSRVYDCEFKKAAYFALGVRQVWLMDRWAKSVDVWRSPSSRETVREVLRSQVSTAGDMVSIHLAEIFANID